MKVHLLVIGVAALSFGVVPDPKQPAAAATSISAGRSLPGGDGTAAGRRPGAFGEAANKALVTYYYDQLFNHRNTAVIDSHLGVNFVQHNPTVADGPEGVRQLVTFLSAQFPHSRSIVHRVMADGDLVLLHTEAISVPGTRGQSIIDIFRVAGGKIVEHWDTLQPVPQATVNGHDMFGTLTASVATAPAPPWMTAASRRTVTAYFTAVTHGRVLPAVKRFVAPNLVQHDPAVDDGADATAAYYTSLFDNAEQATYTVARVVADGDLVAVHSHLRRTPDDLGQSVVDIFRVQGGKIVEHWANVQNVPATSANANTMF